MNQTHAIGNTLGSADQKAGKTACSSSAGNDRQYGGAGLDGEAFAASRPGKA